MYNLFVTANPEGWNSQYALIDKSRFLEYTREHIAAAYQVLTPSHIDALMSYPCLFAIEGKDYPMKVGRLTNITDKEVAGISNSFSRIIFCQFPSLSSNRSLAH